MAVTPSNALRPSMRNNTRERPILQPTESCIGADALLRVFPAARRATHSAAHSRTVVKRLVHPATGECWFQALLVSLAAVFSGSAAARATGQRSAGTNSPYEHMPTAHYRIALRLPLGATPTAHARSSSALAMVSALADQHSALLLCRRRCVLRNSVLRSTLELLGDRLDLVQEVPMLYGSHH